MFKITKFSARLILISLILTIFTSQLLAVQSSANDSKIPSRVKNIILKYVDPNFRYFDLEWSANPKDENIDYYEIKYDYSSWMADGAFANFPIAKTSKTSIRLGITDLIGETGTKRISRNAIDFGNRLQINAHNRYGFTPDKTLFEPSILLSKPCMTKLNRLLKCEAIKDFSGIKIGLAFNILIIRSKKIDAPIYEYYYATFGSKYYNCGIVNRRCKQIDLSNFGKL